MHLEYTFSSLDINTISAFLSNSLKVLAPLIPAAEAPITTYLITY